MDNRYGLYFPIILSQGAPIAPALVDSVDASLRHIFTWTIGTRNFNLSFGSPLYHMLGQLTSDKNLEILRIYSLQAIARWEKRLEVTNLELVADRDTGLVNIQIEGKIMPENIDYTYETAL